MSKVNIEILSPVHIGSGNFLRNNSDFVFEKDGEDACIYIIDERKILELIGYEHINDWILSIDKEESTSTFIKRFNPSASISNYSKQSILCYAKSIGANETLKEIMHNGLGLPYIPGSSLKGAIRTAVLSALSRTVLNKENKIFKIGRDGKKIVDRRGIFQVSAEAIEKELFGKDPNSDIFRFIRVGDAHFQRDTVIATRMINLNIRSKKDSLWDTSKPQLVEALCVDAQSEFDIHIASSYYNLVKSEKSTSVGTMPIELQSLDSLFMLINEHTKQLVEDEINYWQEVSREKLDGEYYIKEMEFILKEINECDTKSCVMRIGHASGWRFITGAWTEDLDNFETNIVPASRPNNFRYQEYDFPKSRRIDDDSYPFGFVKLTINE